jgi:hypothetical protein
MKRLMFILTELVRHCNLLIDPVLWEIITGREPFTHHDDYAIFKESITVKQERPPMDSSIPTPLRVL